MEEDETITTYNSKIKDLANESFSLGERMINEKSVRKMLRTFLKESSKRKGVALQENCEVKENEEEDLAETMSLLAKNFNKTLKRFNKKPYSGSNNPRLPRLEDVLLVEGLRTNLISISQLCDSDDQTDEEPGVKPTDNDSGIEPAARIQKDHPVDNIIGQIDQGMTTRKKDRVDYRKMIGLLGETCFISKEEPKDVKGYTQIEGVNFKETFAPVAKLEAIRLLLSIACLLKFKLFQMDIKSAFLNGVVQEEVYVEQPKGFIDVTYPEHVYKLKKALYGLK
ncbi:hypothetical protein LIER_25964 [Lithospermum erythrorhizon]|uniref:Reverse transcriptase Ty1/copia-type domain-containing protein n=1 Tax=Lithospermum erythrorhizon TaxID=34254 RepID=A0AAV3R883_LITER